MTPQESLDAAMQIILSPEFEPVIAQALEGAASVPKAIASLLGPIVIRMQQEVDLPDEEMFGSEEGDGIATRLAQELIDIAGEAGYLPEEGDEEMAAELGEATALALQDLLAQADEATVQQQQQQQQPPMPPQGGAPMPPQGGLMQEAPNELPA